MLKAILFDFDGVLFDSVGIKTKAFESLFSKYDEKIRIKILNHHLSNFGVTRREKLKIYHEEFLGQRVDNEFLDMRAQEFSRLVVDKVVGCSWINGAEEFLKNNRDLYEYFVVTGTPEEEIQKIIDGKNIRGYFRGVFGAPLKKGDAVREIMKNCNFCSNNLVMIGDGVVDYQAAVDNNVRFVGVGSLFRKISLDVVCVDDLTQLKVALDESYYS